MYYFYKQNYRFIVAIYSIKSVSRYICFVSKFNLINNRTYTYLLVYFEKLIGFVLSTLTSNISYVLFKSLKKLYIIDIIYLSNRPITQLAEW